MKKSALVLAALAAIISCTPKNTHFLSGNISGVESDTLLVIYNSDTESGIMKLDTLVLEDGKIQYDLPAEETGIIMMVEPKHFIDNITLYAVPGENVVINGKMTDYELSGSAFYRDWGAFHKMVEGNEQARRDLLATIPEDREAEPDYDMAAFSARDREIKKEWDGIALDFIKKNPGSDLCAYLAREIGGIDDFNEAETAISEKVKKGRLGHLIESRKLAFDADAVRQASMKDIYEGAVAPDFSLKTSTGETFTLSEHRGGYVMLDFWGTWCGWCIEGLPNVKEIAHRYAGKLTVVSVDCGDTETAWRNGIEEHGMDWVQVYNSKADAVDSKFAVQGYPGFYLIDPEGVIVMMAFGEPANFVEKIGELISK